MNAYRNAEATALQSLPIWEALAGSKINGKIDKSESSVTVAEGSITTDKIGLFGTDEAF
jgi:hypothetical protein